MKIVSSKKYKLFQGEEEDFLEWIKNSFTLDEHSYVSFMVPENEIFLYELKDFYSKSDLEHIAKDSDIELIVKNERLKFKGKSKQSIKIAYSNEYLLLYSGGEKYRGIYEFTIEALWHFPEFKYEEIKAISDAYYADE